MPEWGQLPIPAKLIRQGVTDIVRISDARMSGTAYGTCILHVSPESAIGGPLALARDGDEIELDTINRRLTLHVPDDELARRRTAWAGRAPAFSRGYGRLYQEHVLQAHEGADFDFLEGGPGPTSRRTVRPAIDDAPGGSRHRSCSDPGHLAPTQQDHSAHRRDAVVDNPLAQSVEAE